MQLHELKRSVANKGGDRVGRGGKRGKTAGRGTKGQKARAGHRLRPEMRDIIKKYPKLRGYKFNSTEVKPQPVNLAALEIHFENGDAVTPASLIGKKIVRKQGGRTPEIKILATGTLTKKFVVTGCIVSVAAKAAIEKAGGSVA